MSNSNLKNIKEAVGSTVSATTGTVAVSTKLIADGLQLLAKGVVATPEVAKELLASPFTAGEGYYVADGVDPQEAHDKAFRIVEQEVSVTVRQIALLGGAGIHTLLEDDDDTDDRSDLEKEQAAYIAELEAELNK